jgi:hypothetical protein
MKAALPITGKRTSWFLRFLYHSTGKEAQGLWCVWCFGSEEYLSYAEQKRREWESIGQEIVEEKVQSLQHDNRKRN